jgi:hypothetical protein
MLIAYQRKLTLLDGMIFVAATGVALGWERVYLAFVATHLAAMPRYMVMKYYLYGLVPFLVMYAAILLILSLKLFPSPIRSLARRPGTIACFAIMLGVIAAGLSVFVELAFSAFVYRTLTGGKDIYSAMVAMFTQRVWVSSPIVVGAWSALIVTSRWRPAPDWVDRAGRALGICMVVAHFISVSC